MCRKYKFELYVEDTQLDPNVALQKLQTLYAKGVRAIHAGLASKEASGEKPFADQNRIILFSARSTSSLLAIPNDWLYRIVGSDAKQIKAIGAILKEMGVKNVALIYRKDPFRRRPQNAALNWCRWHRTTPVPRLFRRPPRRP